MPSETAAVPKPTSSSTGTPAHLRRVTFLAGAAALGGFLFGYDSAVINGAVTGIQDHFGSPTTSGGSG